MHREFEFLIKFFSNNGYPRFLVEKFIRKFLDSVYSKKDLLYSVPKKELYFSLPFFGHQSEKLKTELSHVLSRYYPYMDFKFILVNPFKIGSFFHHKDRLPKSMQASLVYEFSCARSGAPVSYVGSTKRHLFERIAEHAGRSHRTL